MRDPGAWARALLMYDDGNGDDGHGDDGHGDDAAEARATALEAAGEAIRGIRSGFSETERFLDDPRVGSGIKIESLSALAPGDEAWAAFVTLVVRRRAAGLLPAISAAYRRGLDERRGIERVHIEAARPLDAETKAAVLDAWAASRKTANPRLSRIDATERLEPGLLGGFRLRAGSIRYDASVSGRLRRLGTELAKPLDRSAAGSGGPA